MSFRVQSKSFSLTYPQSAGLSKEELLEHLKKEKNVEYICVSEEQHEDGQPHLHVHIKYSKRKDIKNQKHYDLKEKHPNIQATQDDEDWNKYVKKTISSSLEKLNWTTYMILPDKRITMNSMKFAEKKESLINTQKKLGTVPERLTQHLLMKQKFKEPMTQEWDGLTLINQQNPSLSLDLQEWERQYSQKPNQQNPRYLFPTLTTYDSLDHSISPSYSTTWSLNTCQSKPRSISLTDSSLDPFMFDMEQLKYQQESRNGSHVMNNHSTIMKLFEEELTK